MGTSRAKQMWLIHWRHDEFLPSKYPQIHDDMIALFNVLRGRSQFNMYHSGRKEAHFDMGGHYQIVSLDPRVDSNHLYQQRTPSISLNEHRETVSSIVSGECRSTPGESLWAVGTSNNFSLNHEPFSTVCSILRELSPLLVQMHSSEQQLQSLAWSLG